MNKTDKNKNNNKFEVLNKQTCDICKFSANRSLPIFQIYKCFFLNNWLTATSIPAVIQKQTKLHYINW